jgi:hypothetical protein
MTPVIEKSVVSPAPYRALLLVASKTTTLPFCIHADYVGSQ